MYFTFTTLTTVGFGDVVPVNDIERLFAAFSMLFGVAIFSLIISEFLAILDRYRLLHYDIGTNRSAQLPQFFFILEKYFNKGHSLKIEMKHKIENYFLHHWLNDKNYPIR